jgi:hypothetical protein
MHLVTSPMSTQHEFVLRRFLAEFSIIERDACHAGLDLSGRP